MRVKKYYIYSLIGSGACSLFIAAILFVSSRDITSSLMKFLIILVFPCILTLGVNALVVASAHSEKLERLIFKKLRSAKALTVVLIIPLMFYQLIIISGWLINFANNNSPMDVKLLGYSMLIGFGCNIWLIYRCTDL